MKTAATYLLALLFLCGVHEKPLHAQDVPPEDSLSAQDLPPWTENIRQGHPRLFFNADTWPAVRDRALGAERAWYAKIKARVDTLQAILEGVEQPAPQDLGPLAAKAAFVYRVTEKDKYLALAKKALETSIRFYEYSLEHRQSVSWQGFSRTHAITAWDWLYNQLNSTERQEYMTRLIQAIDGVFRTTPSIPRENLISYDSGFYGLPSTVWFLGCTAYGTGIAPEQVNRWLVWGQKQYTNVLEYRSMAAGDDGGSASTAPNYVFSDYPWAVSNFFYTWSSSTGEPLVRQWPRLALMVNYLFWNWIPSPRGPAYFGNGDALHLGNAYYDRSESVEGNTFDAKSLYSHMANIRHFYGQANPEAAALAAYLQERLPEEDQTYAPTWFVHPFLLGDSSDELPAPASTEEIEKLPLARHFEQMGQVYMRSGFGPGDTYLQFTAGGMWSEEGYQDMHSHPDALNFILYHRGYLALDSGTRRGSHEVHKNAEHMVNYYAQTVAHNSLIIHQPNEPLGAPHWPGNAGSERESNHGGQYSRQNKGAVEAFQATPDYAYVAADGTEAYQHEGVDRYGESLPQKAERVMRQIVFLPPDVFVLFDRVRTTDPDYQKEWLLHTVEEPQVEGQTFSADHWDGRMLGRTLLPTDAELTPIGGPGKKFWADGRNWDVVLPEEVDNRGLMGRWRVEVTPGGAREADVFLNVIQVGDQQMEGMVDTELIQEGGRSGVRLVRGDGQTWEITFDTEGSLGGHITRVGGDSSLDRELTMDVQAQSGFLLGAP